MNSSSMSMQQKVQWLRDQGVPEEAIQARLNKQTLPSSSTTPTTSPTSFKDKSIDAIPGGSALIASLVGSLLGPGGTIGGAAAGYGAGSAVKNSLKDLMGTQDQAPLEQVSNAAKGTAGETLGASLGALLGPIGSKIFGWGLSKPASVATKEVVKDFANEGGYKLSTDMIKHGISGNPKNWFQTAQKGLQTSWNAAKEMAGTYGDDIGLELEKLLAPLNKVVQEAAPGFKQGAGEAVEKITSEMPKKAKLNIDDLLELNKQINSQTYTGADNPTTSQAAATEAYKVMDKVVKPYLEKHAPEVNKWLKEYGFYKQVAKTAENTAKKSYKPPSNLLNLVSVPFKALTNPYLTTTVGRGMYNLSPLTSMLMGYLGKGAFNPEEQ